MKDIVERLRNWRTVHLARLHLLMEEAADEMERLRADWPEQLQAHSVLIAEQELEIERLRLSSSGSCPDPENAASEDKVLVRHNMTVLTDAERDVLREVCRVYADEDDAGCNEIAFVLDRLLARLDGAANSTPIHREECGEYRTGSDGKTAGAVTIGKNVQEMITEIKKRESPGYPGNISFTLCATEREAITVACGDSSQWGRPHVATLMRLLERTR